VDFEFKIGTPVLTRDGEAGRLKFLVIDSEEEEITGLVVERGQLLRKDIVVPASWVERADEQAVVLDASVPELETLPEYREVEYRAPDPSARPIAGHPPAETRIWLGPYPGLQVPVHSGSYLTERPWVLYSGRLGIGDDEVLVRRGQPIYDNSGRRVATLDHVLADDETHRIQRLVIHRGHWLQRGEDLIVPADAVSYITDQDIHLTLSREDLDQLPRYQPPMDDARLEGAIARGLQTQPETRGQDLDVQVDRGLVRLYGEVPKAVASAALSIANKVQGVIGTEDRTTRTQATSPNGKAQAAATGGNDTAIADQIRDTYQRQQQEDLSDVRVRVGKGVAHLTGTTRNVAGKALAEHLARSVSGVRSVTNDLLPDTHLRARIEAALAENPETALEPVDVLVRGGVATLIGRVSTFEAKEAAEKVARSVAGSRVVLNELEVRPARDMAESLRPVWLWKPD
jgi:osmotically-inducible protein OsmY/sporulation protein YlmC with PRC-barrel domain